MEIYKNKNYSPAERAKDLLSRLTLREKVGQLNQRLYGFNSYVCKGDHIELSKEFMDEAEHWGGIGLLYGLFRADPWSKKDYQNGLSGKNTIKAYNMIQEYVISKSRFSIPALMCEECPHGHQALDGYLLPVNLAVGCSFNPELTKKAFSVCAEQLASLHIDFALISMLDILRDPRWGRSEECYSEDPYLASVMASAVIKGMNEKGIDVVAKHFCAQGVTTGGINASAAAIGERELREIHLPAARSAVKAGAKGFMAAYNEIDGIPCHANEWLLKDLLRKELGFNGIVMADGRAVDRLNTVVASSEEMSALAMNSGVNVSLWDHAFSTLEEAITKGFVSIDVIDESVLKVLTLKFERGLFDNPFIKEEEPKQFNFRTHPETLKLAEETPVLLKNDNGTLPFSAKDKTIAVIGPAADDIYAQLGDYTPPVKPDSALPILNGLKEYASVKATILGITSPFPTDPSLQEKYITDAMNTARKSDKIVVVLGGSSSRFENIQFQDNGAVSSINNTGDFLSLTDCGEGVDIADLNLPDWQLELLSSLKTVGKPIVTVILAGRPYAIKEVSSLSDALIYSFYSGPAGSVALSKILFGEIAPSGRLSVSLPNASGQIPTFYNYKSSYVSRYYDCKFTPKYHFGYGMTYTDFEFSNFSCSSTEIPLNELENRTIKINFTIKNVGNIKAHAVPQLYIRDKIASATPRVKELKAFTKIELLPNEEKSCSLELNAESLKVWNRNMQFVVEKGEFEIFIYEGTENRWQGMISVT